jgi:hypothetical protein
MKNVSFKDWYLAQAGCSILVDFENRLLKVLDHELNICAELVLSNSIDSFFNIVELFNLDLKDGDFHYEILKNGYSNKDYLWRGKIVSFL